MTALIVSLDGDLVHEPEGEGADPHVPEVHQSHQERHVGPAHLNNAHNSAYGISISVLECSKKVLTAVCIVQCNVGHRGVADAGGERDEGEEAGEDGGAVEGEDCHHHRGEVAGEAVVSQPHMRGHVHLTSRAVNGAH